MRVFSFKVNLEKFRAFLINLFFLYFKPDFSLNRKRRRSRAQNSPYTQLTFQFESRQWPFLYLRRVIRPHESG